REGRHDAGAVGDDGSLCARLDLAGPGAVSGRDRVGDAGAARDREELGAEADEAARRNRELHADPAGAVVRHRLHASLAGGEELRDRTEVLLGGVDRELLERLGGVTVLVLARDDLRLA